MRTLDEALQEAAEKAIAGSCLKRMLEVAIGCMRPDELLETPGVTEALSVALCPRLIDQHRTRLLAWIESYERSILVPLGLKLHIGYRVDGVDHLIAVTPADDHSVLLYAYSDLPDLDDIQATTHWMTIARTSVAEMRRVQDAQELAATMDLVVIYSRYLPQPFTITKKVSTLAGPLRLEVGEYACIEDVEAVLKSIAAPSIGDLPDDQLLMDRADRLGFQLFAMPTELEDSYGIGVPLPGGMVAYYAKNVSREEVQDVLADLEHKVAARARKAHRA